jgi:two-component system, chemotaxis family, response regulator PixG
MDSNKADINNVSASQGLAKGSPIEVLEQFCGRQVTGRIIFSNDQVNWIVRLESGMVTYVSNSVDPFDRLVCHLRYLSHKLPSLTKEFRSQVCLMFENAPDAEDDDAAGLAEDKAFQTNDYKALCWLVSQQHLTTDQAAQLIEAMLKEAIEPLFWLDQVNYRFTKNIGNPLTLCRLEFQSIATQCLEKLMLWQMFAPRVWSPYQRPYFFGQTEQQKMFLPELQLPQQFSTILKGFSFRHLAVLLNKDDIKVAGSLLPYICEEVVILRDPQPPFDLLPKIPSVVPTAFQKFTLQVPTVVPQLPTLAISSGDTMESEGFAPLRAASETLYKVACVDDSPIVLDEIARCLDDGSFQVFAVNDPMQALAQMLEIKPNLILLDDAMPIVNGYDLCKLLRNSASFKQTPIIMMSDNTGFVDRAKARLAGATDCLAKPFSQDDLLKIIFRHIA